MWLPRQGNDFTVSRVKPKESNMGTILEQGDYGL
jgi:hypothetical protein